MEAATTHSPPMALTFGGGGVESCVPAPLRLDDVRRLASKVRGCEYQPQSGRVAHPQQRATFRKRDTGANGGYVTVNVFCAEAAVGICFEHNRQGKTQTFCRNVDMHKLREIFQHPRRCAGYPDLKKPGYQATPPELVVGDRVRVAWRDATGVARYEVATLIELRDYLSGMMKVLFDTGKSFRVYPNQLTRIDLRTVPVPKAKCQSLKNELDLQLRRLNREMESIQRERLHVLKHLQDIAQGQIAQERLGANTSPTSVAWPGQDSPVQFSDAHLKSVLEDSGAFTHDQASSPFSSAPNSVGYTTPLLNHNLQGSSSDRSLTPPLNLNPQGSSDGPMTPPPFHFLGEF